MGDRLSTFLYQFVGAASALGVMVLFCSPDDLLRATGQPTFNPVIFITIGIGALLGGQIASHRH